MEYKEILQWLKNKNNEQLEKLYKKADEVRKKCVGEEIYLRGLIEISNFCRCQCVYCGVRGERNIPRYRMNREEIIECAKKAVEFGYGTVVLQSGEDLGVEVIWLADVIKEIKEKTGLAITLSLGEKTKSEYEILKKAGANRYLLRLETSNEKLFKLIHPSKKEYGLKDRLECLKVLKEIGFEVGSGVMVGIPGSTWMDLANDIKLFKELDLDMIGIGPYLVHPDTPLVSEKEKYPLASEEEQVPNDEITTGKVLALTRLNCPYTNIPATTALSVVNKENGRKKAFTKGANIIMPNLTPIKYRKLYEIYPGKALIQETAEEIHQKLLEQIKDSGRIIGNGPGNSKNKEIRDKI